MSLLMVMALTMAAGLAWSRRSDDDLSQSRLRHDCGKDVCKAECPYKAEGNAPWAKPEALAK